MKRVVIFILCVVLAISCSVSAFATESFSSASVSAIDAFINSEAFGGKNPQSHESRNTNAINSVTDVVNSDYWKKLVRSDRIAACQIPLELLDNLSTPELVQAVLDFPFFIDIFAFDSFDIGYACLLSECYALQTLITRADRAKVMLGIYEQATVVTRINSDDEARQFKNLWNLELLISQDDFIDIMTEKQKNDLVNIAHSKVLIKQANPDIYAASTYAFFESVSENESLDLRNYPSIVFTPNGTPVLVYVWSDSDVDYTTTEINNLNSQYDTAYPYATRLANPTKKYNCHSYAWYSQATSNIRWMDDPSNYITDGSYSAVSKIHTSVGDIMVYFLSVDGTCTGINHSAIIVSYTDYPRSHRTFEVVSKWGTLGLYEHSWADGPYASLNGGPVQCDLAYYH